MKHTNQKSLLITLFSLLLSMGICSGSEGERDKRMKTLKKDKVLQERFVYYTTNFASGWQKNKWFRDLENASEAGYQYILLDDTKFNYLHKVNKKAYQKNIDIFKNKAEELGLKVGACVFHVGTAIGLKHFPELAEGFTIQDAPFVVAGKEARPLTDPAFKLKNGDFESPAVNKFSGFIVQDLPGEVTFADNKIFHSGKYSLKIKDPGKNKDNGKGRIAFAIKGPEYRGVEVSFWVKTANFSSKNVPRILVYQGDSLELIAQKIQVSRNQDWIQQKIILNTGKFSDLRVYIGIWGGSTGEMWIDDIQVKESGFMNVVNRPSSPIKVIGNNGKVYTEGVDYEPTWDKEIGKRNFRPGKVAPLLKLTPNSSIKDGEKLKISSMQVFNFTNKGTSLCLSCPEAMEYYKKSAAQINEVVKPDFWLMFHDEIRSIKNCPHCLKLNKTPGEILSKNVNDCYHILKKLTPNHKIYVWNDMFDPYHNAKKSNYYYVNGSLENSWKDLPRDVIIMNWANLKNSKSYDFFASNGFNMVVGGYYDAKNAFVSGENIVENCFDRSNIVGVMYTPWSSNYKKLGEFMAGVNKGLSNFKKGYLSADSSSFSVDYLLGKKIKALIKQDESLKDLYTHIKSSDDMNLKILLLKKLLLDEKKQLNKEKANNTFSDAEKKKLEIIDKQLFILKSKLK